MNQSIVQQISPWQRWFILIGMCLAVFTVSFTGTAIVNAMLVIQKSLHLSTAALPWLTNSYFLAAASLIIISGRASEIFGRRNMFVLGVMIFVIGSVIIACSNTTGWVLAARAIQGVGASIVTPGTLAIVKTRFPPEQQTFATSTWSTSIGFGFAIGPIVGGALTNSLGWHYIFWLLALLFILSLVLVLLAKPSNIKIDKGREIDYLGLVLLLLTLVPFILGFSNGTSWGWNNHWTLGLLIWGAFFFILLLSFEVSRKKPLVNFQFFKFRLFSLSAFGLFCVLFTLMGVLYFINLYLQNPVLFNYAPLKAGIYLLPYSVSFFIASFFTAKIIKKFKIHRSLVFASLLCGGGFLWLCFIKVDTSYLFIFGPLILLGLGSGFNLGALPGLGMISLPDEKANAASGLISTLLYLGGIVCTVLGAIFMVAVGHHNIVNSLNKIPIPLPEKFLIVNNLSGQYLAIQQALQPLSDSLRQQAMLAIQHATIDSFIAVMVLCGSVSLFLALMALVLIPRRRDV